MKIDMEEFHKETGTPWKILERMYKAMTELKKGFMLEIDSPEGLRRFGIKLHAGYFTAVISLELSKSSLQEKLDCLGRNLLIPRWIPEDSKFILVSDMDVLTVHFCVAVLMYLDINPGTPYEDEDRGFFHKFENLVDKWGGVAPSVEGKRK